MLQASETSAQKFLRKWKVRCFYHFTDIANLDSIREHGLLCLAELRRREIEIPSPGGSDLSHRLDQRAGLDEFVHLRLRNSHPMEYRAKQERRIGESRFLEISPRVIRTDGVSITTGIAYAQGVEHYTLSEALEVMDFEVIYTRTNWRDAEIQRRLRAAEKYELLIPQSIPPEMIRGL